MHQRIRQQAITVICAAMLIAACLAPVRGQTVAPFSAPPEILTENLTREIIETIMAHHIDPPTRQQMILEAYRGICDATSQRLPPDSGGRISAISDIDALYSLLDRIPASVELSQTPQAKITLAVLERLNRVVPGGLQIVPKNEHNVNEQLAANRYVGIGVGVSIDSEAKRLNFMKVIEDGPADAAGVLAGDILETVDGKDTYNVALAEVVQWLRGPEDSAVKLTV